MINYNIILIEEQQKISALSSGKIDKYELITNEEILSPDQRRVIEQAKFAYSPLGKAFEKQTKTIEEQGKKQVQALEILDPEKSQKLKSFEGLFPKEMRNDEIENEIDEIKNGKIELNEKSQTNKQIKQITNNKLSKYIYIYIYIYI